MKKTSIFFKNPLLRVENCQKYTILNIVSGASVPDIGLIYSKTNGEVLKCRK